MLIAGAIHGHAGSLSVTTTVATKTNEPRISMGFKTNLLRLCVLAVQ